MELSKKNKAMLASYARSVVGAASTLYIAGVTDPKDLWAALVGALIPVSTCSQSKRCSIWSYAKSFCS